MKLFVKHTMAFIAIIANLSNPTYGQINLMCDSTCNLVPESTINTETKLFSNKRYNTSISRKANANSHLYKYGKHEQYTKEGENGAWDLYNTSYYNYNDLGYLIKDWDVGMGFYTDYNNYSLYFYDDQNRNTRIENFFDDGGTEGLCMSSYHIMEYLTDFPEIESSWIYYTRESEWDYNTNNWKYVWQIYSGRKKDYTISRVFSFVFQN